MTSFTKNNNTFVEEVVTVICDICILCPDESNSVIKIRLLTMFIIYKEIILTYSSVGTK